MRKPKPKPVEPIPGWRDITGMRSLGPRRKGPFVAQVKGEWVDPCFKLVSDDRKAARFQSLEALRKIIPTVQHENDMQGCDFPVFHDIGWPECSVFIPIGKMVV